MIKEEEVYRIGILHKPHGVRGEIVFTFTDDIFDSVDCDYLILKLDGILVPFFIEEYRFRSDEQALVKFEGIDTLEEARKYTNIEVYFPKSYVESNEVDDISWHYFMGFEIEDIHHGLLGKIIDVDDYTVNILFTIETSAGVELILPANEDFIVEIDHEQKKILVDMPEGILTLDELDEK